MLCANCKKEALEIQDEQGVTYTKCETCGWLEYNQAGEAIPCEPRDDLLQPVEGEQIISPAEGQVGPDSEAHPAEAAEPAPNIEPKPKPKPKPKPEPHNEPSPIVEVHFDDD